MTANNEFIVEITADKTNFITTEDVVLEAGVTSHDGSSGSYTYTWKEGSGDLDVNTATLTKKFDAGFHTVTVDVESDGVTKSSSFEFNVTDMSDFTIEASTITQTSTDLMWVNEPDVSKGACLAIRGDEYNATKGYDDSLERAKTFCNTLDFAGFQNWRTPYTTELTEYIVDTNEANIETEYDRPCPQLLGINEGTDLSDGSNYRAVTTRYMNTQYYPNIGTIRDHTYASDVDRILKYNVGLRCVRNVDGSGGEDIPGANIVVSITGAKSSYLVDEDVNLTASVTGATDISSYSWIEDGLEIGTLETLSKNDFAVGEHTLTLLVTADDVNKSKSVTFSVKNAPDLSDFNITSLTANKDEVIIQNSTNLMWVNESNVSKGKCAKIHNVSDTNLSIRPAEFESAKTFCSSSSFGNFAGLGGWRTPTASELKAFIETTIDADILPAYDAPCNKLLALKDGAANATDRDNYVTVTTRYSATAGIISDDGVLVPNIGLRCVRDHQ